MQVKKKHQGVSAYRYKDNPLEKQFALAWQEENSRTHGTLDYLLSSGTSLLPEEPSEEARVVSNTVIQWLGSPVGQCFLKRVLQTKPGKKFLQEILGYFVRDEDE